MDKDAIYMKKSLSLAKLGEGYTSPNPLVGAVIVKNNKIVGKGYHQNYGGVHAEVNALKDAANKAQHGTLYVNLEPCSHYGKTPPCASAIIKAEIKRVVVAMKDPNPLVAGRGIELLKDAGIEVKIGVLVEEARQLNEAFIKYITTEFPFVYLKTAQTLDGFLATGRGDSKWITNKQAREYGHQLRHKVDAILVGIGTILKDNPRLNTRFSGKEGKDSLRVVLDTKLSIPLEARIINQESTAGTLIVTSEGINNRKNELLEKKENVEILQLPVDRKGKIPLKKLLYFLHNKNISSLLVEGGGSINYSFLTRGLIDKIFTFIAPRILGGNDGVSAYSGSGPETMEFITDLKEVRFQQLGDNMLVTGKLT